MNSENRIGLILDKWILFVFRHALWVLLFFVVLSTASCYFTWTHIGINTNTDDMLSTDLPYRQIRKDYFKSFPYHNDMILLVIDAKSNKPLQIASRQLADSLRQHSSMFNTVFVAGADNYFYLHRMLYLDETKFIRFSRDLLSNSTLLAKLQQRTSASVLLNELANPTDNQTPPHNSILTNIIQQTIQVVEQQRSDSPVIVDWNNVLTGSQTPSTNNPAQQLIILEPTEKYRDVLTVGEAFSLIRQTASKLNISPKNDMQLRITGSLAMAEAELFSVSQGMGFAGMMALSLVVILLWFGSRSFKILAFSFISLIIGLSLTAGIAALFIGSLNLISVAFAVLYIGLGIDFSIHLCLRYQELLIQQHTHKHALRTTLNDVGVSLVICAISTAIGFYAFIPTDFIGLSELGLISGSGMFISLIVSLSVLPALFQLSPLQVVSTPAAKTHAIKLWFSIALQRYRRMMISIFIVLVIGSLLLVPQSYFDYDLLNMRDQQSESVATYRDLASHSENSPTHISILADDVQQAQILQKQLSALPLVKKVSSVYSLIPENQQQRLRQLKSLSTSLVETTVTTSGNNKTQTQQSTIAELEKILASFDKNESALLYNRLSQLVIKLKQQNSNQARQTLVKLDHALTSSFNSAMQQLKVSLNTNKITLQSLPDEERRQWISPITQRVLLLVYPRHTITELKPLREFVQQVKTVSPNATNTPAISLAAGDVAVNAFKQALLIALVLITLLLLLIYKNIQDTLLVLTPLLLAALFTTALAVLLDIPFNFSNIIAIPLLFGIGVDNGIHMMSRVRTTGQQQHILHTSTSRAVVLSALTTIASFGNLGYSSHPGTASMGQLLTMGVLLTLLCTLFVLPVLLTSIKSD